MQDLINSIAAKAGISADQATSAVNGVLEFFKTKMPEGVVTQIQNVMSGQNFDMGDLLKSEASDKLGDLKDAASDKIHDLKEGAQNLMGKIGL
jgi:hypothetical protein